MSRPDTDDLALYAVVSFPIGCVIGWIVALALGIVGPAYLALLAASWGAAYAVLVHHHRDY